MPRYLACAALLLAGLAPICAFALGLGEIDLKSGLNQPFRAEIAINSESADELTGVEVELASRETFEHFGIDRAAFLGDFKFSVVTSGGATSIYINSRQPVVEPFVTILLEIRWPQGRLLREYTVLLDPPAFAAPEVQLATQEPVAGPEAMPEPARIQRAPEPEPAAAQPPEPAAVWAPQAEPAPAAVRAPPAEPAPPAGTSLQESPEIGAELDTEPEPEAIRSADEETFIWVLPGDTLWGIAASVGSDASVDRNQMMLAIFRANPGAFVGNVNRLKAGMILRIPGSEELGRFNRYEAMIEVQRQAADWKPSSEQSRLRLVPPPEPGAGDAAGSTAAAEQATATEVADAAEREALKRRITELQVELGSDERLILAQNDDLVALQALLIALQERVDEANAAAEAARLEARSETAEAPEPAMGVIEPGPEATGSEDPFAAPDELTPEPPPIVETTPVPSDVVTTPQPSSTSWVGALFTNIWLYVSLFVVLVLALFIARRRSSPIDGDVEDWAEPLGGDGDGDAGVEDWAEPLDDIADIQDFTSPGLTSDFEEASGELSSGDGTLSDEFIDEEESPDERTIQDENVQDQASGEFAAMISEESAGEFDPGLDAEFDAGLNEALLDGEATEEADQDELADTAETREMPIEATGELEQPEAEPDLEFDPLPDVNSEAEHEATGELEPALEPDLDLETDFDVTDALELPSDAEPEPEEEEEPEPESAYAAAGEDVEMTFERTISIASPANLDEADPIAEADFHMAYGLYDQAAGLLTGALPTAQNQKELRLKLLEVYFIWENADEFLKEAEALKSFLDGDSDADWNKVLIMGKQICPDEELFSARVDIPGEAGDMDLAFTDESQDDEEYDVDIPLADATLNFGGEETGAHLDIAGVEDMPDDLDFDIGDDSEETRESPTLESAALDPTVDIAALEPMTETPDGEFEESVDAFSADSPTVDIAALEPMTETPEGEFEEGEGAWTEESPTLDIAAIEPTVQTPTIRTQVALSQLDETSMDFAMGDEDSDDEGLLSISSVDLAAETLTVETEDDTNIQSFDSEDSADEDAFQGMEPTEILQRADDRGGDETAEQLLQGDVSATTGMLRNLDDPNEDSIGDASTLSEVGTKLDLARAYIDMGDPDGARSILNEVVEEAGDSQRQEAQQLLAGLG